MAKMSMKDWEKSSMDKKMDAAAKKRALKKARRKT